MGDYIVSVGGVDCKWLGVNELQLNTISFVHSCGRQERRGCCKSGARACAPCAGLLARMNGTAAVAMQKASLAPWLVVGTLCPPLRAPQVLCSALDPSGIL